VGSYDARFLTRFRSSNSIRKNISIRLEWSDHFNLHLATCTSLK
jgi:hypothetical protein